LGTHPLVAQSLDKLYALFKISFVFVACFAGPRKAALELDGGNDSNAIDGDRVD
jgi:hypothetical protein